MEPMNRWQIYSALKGLDMERKTVEAIEVSSSEEVKEGLLEYLNTDWPAVKREQVGRNI